MGDPIRIILIIIGLQFSHITCQTFLSPTGNPTITSLEGTAVGTIIQSFVMSGNPAGTDAWSFAGASDPDCDIYYELAPESTNTRKCDLQIKADLDFETAAVRQLSCVVRFDNGAVTKSVILKVSNKFDVTPTLDLPAGESKFTADCTEEEAPETACTMANIPVMADDEIGAAYDPDDKLVCTVEGSTMFDVVPDTCKVRMKQTIDRDILSSDVYSALKLRVTDSGGNFIERPLEVTMVDINDNAPSCPAVQYKGDILETEAVNYQFVTISGCTDIDAGDNADLKYSTDDTKFGVDNTGKVFITQTFDYDTITDTQYKFRVFVRDNTADATKQKTFTATVTATILPVNDFTPQFDVNANVPYINTIPNVTSTINEEPPGGTTIATLVATDADRPGTPHSNLVWSLKSVTATTGGNLLPGTDINPLTGKIYVTDPSYWDAESYGGADITASVCDKGVPPLCNEVTFRVTITGKNEFPPTFIPASGFFAVSHPEGTAAGTNLVTLNTDDEDAPDDGITCTLTHPQFYMNGNRVRNTNILDLDDPNNMDTVYTLFVSCTDGPVSHKITATVVITIIPHNDHTPTITTSPATNAGPFNEQTTAIGATIVTLSVNDADYGRDGDLTCVISSPPSTPFILDGCDKMRLGTALDREDTASYTVVIDAIDNGDVNGKKTGQATVTVTVGDADDNSPVCNPSVYTATLPENVAANNFVQVTCPDADTHGVTYSLAVDYGGIFSVNPTTGRLSATNALDYETATSYSLVVKSTDNNDNSKTSTALVQVSVQNVNDQAPQVTDKSISIAEDTSPGTPITTMTITDPDTGTLGIKNIIVKSVSNYGGTIPNSYFTIDRDKRVILMNKLDYEFWTADKVFLVTIEAEDGAGATGSGVLTVTLTDVNDNGPSCTQDYFTNSVDENLGAGVSTGITVNVNDLDGTAVNQDPLYSFISGDTTLFDINPTTGVITAKGTPNLDYETATQHKLVVQAQDKGGTGNTVQCNVVINVNDLDDNPTTFSTSTDTITINEDTALGTVLYSTAVATDLDGTAEITYSINPADNKFYVDAKTGKLYLQQALDFETAQTHTVTIRATETKSSDTADFILNINVNDINEAAPICDPKHYVSYNLIEGTATNRDVATLACTDADTGQTLTYSVKSVNTVAGDDSGRFTMLGNVVKQSTALDYEGPNKYVVEVLVKDAGSPTENTGTATVTLFVLPDNEAAPTISPASSNVVEGTATNTFVLKMTASDTDKGADHGTVKFRIIGGNANGYFRITDDGDIYVNKPPDRETEATVTLQVQAYDGPGLTADTTATFTITDINDNRPVFNPAFHSVKVSESSASGFTVIDFASITSDADEGANANLGFSMTPTGTPFSIDGTKLKVNGVLNVATQSVYTLTVTATDGGTNPSALSTSIPVVIEIIPPNTNVPSFTSTNTVTIPENEPVGSIIFTAKATDTDNGAAGEITYSIYAGNTGDAFYINADTGDIQVMNPLDYDIPPNVYTLGVKATDKYTPFNTATYSLTVTLTDVNDNAPVFSDSSTSPFHIFVTENNAANFPVHTITISDADSDKNGEVEVTLLSQYPQTPVHFSYSDTTKIITATATLDREKLDYYEVVLKAVDKAVSPETPKTTLQLYRITVVDQNDNTPSFLPITNGQTYYITEQTAPVAGVVVGDFPATDPDLGINANLVYSVQGINPSAVPFVFAGTQLQSDLTGTLDRETYTHYVLRLLARDSASPPTSRLTGCLTITVSLIDINDNTPVANPTTYTGTIKENDLGGTVAANVLATDADLGLNAKLKYSISAGDPNNFFSINQEGQVFITVNGSLNREAIGTHTLTIRIEDSGSPIRFINNVIVTVTVGDINDNRPVFPPNPVRSIPENSNVGALVGLVVSATDADTGANAALTYTINRIISGVDHFEIDPVTAQVKVKYADLDRETLDTYLLELYAVDNGSPKLTGSVTLTISITDVNDNSPIIQGTYTSVTVNENVPIGTNITQIVATDADIDTNGQIRYTMIPGLADYTVANTLFDLNVNTGVLTAKTTIDREQYSTVTFHVLAQDQGLGLLNATTIVTVTINDLNDFAPAFTSTLYNGEMAYKEDRLVELVQVSATDGDATFNTVTYNFVSATTYLDISPTTGIVTHKAGSSTPGVNSIMVRTVRATDNYPLNPRSSDTLVRIDIYEPSDTVVCMTLTMSESDFISKRKEILTKLQATLTFKYPTNRPGYYKHTVESDSKTKACFYVVANNVTDYTTQTSTTKTFVPVAELLQYWRASSSGTPTAVLTSSTFDSYPITHVEPYDAANTTVPLLWYQEAWGIAVLTLLSILGAVAIGLTAWGIYKCVTNKPVNPAVRHAAIKHPPARPLNNAPPAQHPAPAPKVNGPKHLPNEIYYDKNVWKGTPSPNIFESTRLGNSPTRQPTPVGVNSINF